MLTSKEPTEWKKIPLLDSTFYLVWMYYETEYSWDERNPYIYCTLWKNFNTGIVSRDNKPLENLGTCLFRLMNIRKVKLGGKFTCLITSFMTESKIF